jgi:hypothetical protein
MMYWLQNAVLVCLGAMVANVLAFEAPEYPSAEWKVLVIIKERSTASCNGCSGTLTKGNIDTYGQLFLNVLPTAVHNMSRGLLRITTEVVVSPNTVTDMDVAADYVDIQPKHIPDDVKLFNISGSNYDQVYVVGPMTKWGYRGGDDFYGLGVGWASSSLAPDLEVKPEGVMGYIHEIFHGQLRWYYRDNALGESQSLYAFGNRDDPADPTHEAENWKYTEKTGGDKGIPVLGEPFSSWGKWYMDVLNAEVCMQDGNGDCQDPSDKTIHGLGPAAWKFPTVREAANNLPAGYLATHGTYPGEPATSNDYLYAGYSSARNWKRMGDTPSTVSSVPTSTSSPDETSSTLSSVPTSTSTSTMSEPSSTISSLAMSMSNTTDTSSSEMSDLEPSSTKIFAESSTEESTSMTSQGSPIDGSNGNSTALSQYTTECNSVPPVTQSEYVTEHTTVTVFV